MSLWFDVRKMVIWDRCDFWLQEKPKEDAWANLISQARISPSDLSFKDDTNAK